MLHRVWRAWKHHALAAALLAALVLAGSAIPASAAPTAPFLHAEGAARSPQAHAEQDGLSADLSLAAPQGWQPGVPIDLTVTIRYPAGARVLPPELPQQWGAWDVRSSALLPPTREGERLLRVTLVAWDAGALTIPAIPVSAELADGRRVDLAVGPAEVTLESLLAEETPLTELAAPVRDAVDISTVNWWWYLGAALGAGICMWLARLLFVTARRPAPTPPLPPDAWALREMDRLEGEGLPARGDVDAFFARLSDIVRHYVEQRWGVSAPEQTTKEFLQSARHHPELSGTHEQTLGKFLRIADMVKFAAVRPGAPECGHALTSMRAFVRNSAPMPEPQPQGGAHPHAAPSGEPSAASTRSPEIRP